MSDVRLDLFEELGDLVAANLRAPSSPPDIAGAVVWLARKHLPCDETGITGLDRDGTLRTLACTDVVIEDLDGLQQALGEGPTLQSLTDDTDLVVADLSNDRHWPSWGPAATGLGVRGVQTVRLAAHAGLGGTLSLYSSTPRSITRADFDIARLFAHEASVAFRVTHEVWHLNKAIDNRTLIGQAEGFLMNRFQVDADQAFAMLKRVSSETNRKLHAVASDLLATGQLPSVGTSGGDEMRREWSDSGLRATAAPRDVPGLSGKRGR